MWRVIMSAGIQVSQRLSFPMPSMGELIGGFSGTKSRLLVFAGLFVVAGLILNAGKWLPSSDSTGRSVNPSTSVRSDWTENSRAAVSVVHHSRTWGDVAIRLGLSFMIAMVAASLLRAFLKTMISVLLMAVVVCWFLNYRGIIDPFWEDYYSSLGEAKNWAISQTDTIKTFLKGYVPSVGAALVGFGFGLKN